MSHPHIYIYIDIHREVCNAKQALACRQAKRGVGNQERREAKDGKDGQ